MKRVLLNLFISSALLLSAVIQADAKLSIKYPCSDGMVLQQQTKAVVWGHADAGQKVDVTTSWDGKTYNAKTDSKGVWKVYVQTPGASYTNYEIGIKCGQEGCKHLEGGTGGAKSGGSTV